MKTFKISSFIAAIGRLCEKCDGKCVICDSYVRPCTLVRICDECNYGSYQGRCVICGGPGVSDAYYCKECTIQEKDVRSFNHVIPLSISYSPCRETAARRSLTLGAPKRICSTRERNTDSSRNNIALAPVGWFYVAKMLVQSIKNKWFEQFTQQG